MKKVQILARILLVALISFGSQITVFGQWNNSSNNYSSGKLGLGINNNPPTTQLEVAGTGTGLFRNVNYSTNGYIEGAVNIFRNNEDGIANTVLNLGNYYNTNSTNNSILAIDFRSGDAGGIMGGAANPTGRIKVQTSWVAPYMDFDLAGKNILRLQDNGNVGIGTTNTPSEKLEINGNLKFTSEYNRIYFPTALNFAGGITGDDLQYKKLTLFHGNSIAFETGTNEPNFNNTRMIVTKEGNVGIGTNTPQSLLSVAGIITAKEIRVTLNGWADYVFENTYNLRPLSQVESFIKENKHLPEIPSANEVKANGINLGEMDALLLKKIEELTLYTIEMNKKVEEMQKTVEKVQKENESLKKQIQSN